MFYLGSLLIIGIILFFSLFAHWIIYAIGLWKVLEKTGEPGWKACIPFYGFYTLSKNVSKKEYYWVYLVCFILCFAFLPQVNILLTILFWVTALLQLYAKYLIMVDVSLAFGQNKEYAFALVLLTFIFVCILGFGKAEYDQAYLPRNLEA